MKLNEKSNNIGFKAIAVGILLIPLNVYWIAQLEVVRYTHPTLIVPFFNVIFFFLAILLLNIFLNKTLKITLFNQGEIITIYIMLSVSSAIASIDMLQILISNMGHVFYFATPENEWKELIWEHIPRYLVVDDQFALKGYYEGGNFFQWYNIKPWVFPVFLWLCFVMALVFTLLCLSGVLSHQWTEKEKLTYPIIRLPMEMASPETKFFKNKIMWLGFGIAASISLINGLNYFFPKMPVIPVKRMDINSLFTERPWSYMGGLRVSFYPFVIGVSFLIPIDLLLSCWSFYWIYKLEIMLGGIVGFRSLPNFPYQSQQAFGAIISILFFVVWMGKGHLKRVFLQLFGSKKDEESQNSISYRYLVSGFILGFVFLFLFSSRIGMSFYVIPAFFVIYILISTFITRMRAELGLCVHNLSELEPRRILMAVLGTKNLSKDTLATFALYGFFNRAYRSHPMPHILEGMKMWGLLKLDFRRLFWAIMLAVVFTVVIAFWEYLHLYYKFGASSGYFGPWTLGLGNETFTKLQNWLFYPTEPDKLAISFMGVGFIIASILSFLRLRFLWFPFHPLGYAMAGDWGMYNLWSCFFTSFLLKWFILKYGGLRSYRRSVPLFLGLALGDLTIGSIWSIIGVFMNATVYQPFP